MDCVPFLPSIVCPSDTHSVVHSPLTLLLSLTLIDTVAWTPFWTIVIVSVACWRLVVSPCSVVLQKPSWMFNYTVVVFLTPSLSLLCRKPSWSVMRSGPWTNEWWTCRRKTSGRLWVSCHSNYSDTRAVTIQSTNDSVCIHESWPMVGYIPRLHICRHYNISELKSTIAYR